MTQKTVFIAGFIGLLFGILFSGTLGLDFFGTNEPDNNNYNNGTTLEEQFEDKYNIENSIYVVLSGEEAYEKMENGDSFVLYIGRDTCPYCQQHVPNLMEAAQNHGLTELYHVNTIDSNNRDFVQTEGISVTPTTYFIVDGVVAETLYGFRTTEELETILLNHYD